jgi:hypothetical protein
MDNSKGWKYWVKRNVQMLSLLDNCFRRDPPSVGVGRPFASVSSASISRLRLRSPAHVAFSRKFWCRQHGPTTTRGLEGLLSDRRGALHAFKSNRREKALRILERSAAPTESLPPDVYQTPLPRPMWRSPEVTAPNMIQSASPLGRYLDLLASERCSDLRYLSACMVAPWSATI